MIGFEEIVDIIKILYVEDEEISRTITENILKKRTKNLFVAKNGEEGLELLGKYRPHIIITDLRMPVLDGISMIKEIRKLDHECGIIITSELQDLNVIIEGIDIGIDKYVIKPLNEEKIDEAIMSVLKKIRNRRGYDKLFTHRLDLSKEDKKKLEENIKTEISNFLKKSMGKGPKYVKVIISENVIEITNHEVLTYMEKTLIEDKSNLNLVEYNRALFYKQKKKDLERIITDIVNRGVLIKNTEIDILGDKDRIIFECF